MRKILVLMTIYIALIAIVITLAVILFSLPGCSPVKQVPATNQISKTKFIRLVQVDKDSAGKVISEIKKINYR